MQVGEADDRFVAQAREVAPRRDGSDGTDGVFWIAGRVEKSFTNDDALTLAPQRGAIYFERFNDELHHLHKVFCVVGVPGG